MSSEPSPHVTATFAEFRLLRTVLPDYMPSHSDTATLSAVAAQVDEIEDMHGGAGGRLASARPGGERAFRDGHTSAAGDPRRADRRDGAGRSEAGRQGTTGNRGADDSGARTHR